MTQTASGPAGSAMLHLSTDLAAELEPVLTEWCDRVHHRQLLTVPGFLSARRARLTSAGMGRLLTMYQLADPESVHLPRTAAIDPMPPELTGKVSYDRRVLIRLSADTPDVVGAGLLQLVRQADSAQRADTDELRVLPEVLAVTEWRDLAGSGGGPDVLLAELSESAEPDHADLVKQAGNRFPGWTISSYRQVFPAGGVLLPGASF